MALQTPYLDAIQAIPGDTPGEKFRWIAKLTKERLLECDRLEEVAETDQIPKPLAPLIQVQAALLLNKKDPTNQASYDVIAEALKSGDEMVMSKAFEAGYFFDGSNTTITSVQYFFENLFPYVSLNTRIRIVKALAKHLACKRPDLAERFFVAVTDAYGIEQALPLLMACNESFMFDTIVEKRIVLSRKQIKDLFRKNPDFVVRYFRLSKPNTDPYQRDLHSVNVYEFGDFLAALIKKRLDSFVELYEMHKNVPPNVSLSNKCAESFLKNGKEHLQRNPKLYIDILPLKLISAKRMESIFAKLYPENAKDFQTDCMLDYLKYYPQEKKVDLFLRTYREVYGRSLLDTSGNVTPSLLKILPPIERVKQARIKLAEETIPVKTMKYAYSWRCYLSTDESIPYYKQEISTTAEMEYRAAAVCKMIFSCQLNNDYQALLNVLAYTRDRHKNEQCWFTLKVFECLLELYDLPQLSEAHWAVLMDMIMNAYVKNELPAGNTVSEKIVEAAIHSKIIRKQPIDQVIGILIDMKSTRYTRHWNVLEKYPEYERMCLEACLAVVAQKYNSNKTQWKEDKVGILFDICSSIYHFNENHVNKNSRIERMSAKNYPWLLEKISEILSANEQSNVYMIQRFKWMLETHEKELYERFWPMEKEKIASIESGDALRLLKKNPESILAKWQDYLEVCRSSKEQGQAKRFVKAVRWYKEIPVRFAEKCIQDFTNEKEDECLNILATLLHGSTFVRIIEPLIPAGDVSLDIHNKDAKFDYMTLNYLMSVSKIVNPPVPLQLVSKFFVSGYMSFALTILINTCRRTSTMDVISFANALSNQRVSVRKHGIRVMYMVAPRDYLRQFLLTKWKSEEHYSIREVLFAIGRQLFLNEPDQPTWAMLNEMIATLSVKDKSAMNNLTDMLKTVPNEYVVGFVKLVLNTVDRYAAAGFPEDKIHSSIDSLLSKIDAAICNLLPEEFVEELLRRYLFHPEPSVSRSAALFMITAYLLPAKDKLDTRMKIFSNIFVEVVTNGWNVAHPKKSLFYPVNHMVGLFVKELIYTISFVNTDPRLIDGILTTFLSVLTPQMDPTSYLLLAFMREYVSVKTPREFGVRIGQLMPQLVNHFTLVFTFFVSSVLQYLLDFHKFKDYDKEDSRLSVIEGLTEVGSIEAMLMAVKLLSPVKNSNYWDRYNKLVIRFKNSDHPAVKSVVCDILNKTTCNECVCDM